jgi:N-acetylglucosamine kinase-like BadF-type ATPase
MPSSYRIGVDGGGTKTELILIDENGAVVARHTAPGCNPSVIGTARARTTLLDELTSLQAESKIENLESKISTTLLCLAGSPAFWQETVSSLSGYGRIQAETDALPVLELATGGKPGLVLHAGTGSFVALRDHDGAIRYAGGLGWRIGDPGSAQDIGRRALGRALAELQGWAHATGLGPALRETFKTDNPSAITAALHRDPEPNQRIGVFAMCVSYLAQAGDIAARDIILASTGDLLACAEAAAKTFLAPHDSSPPAGLSGPILTQPFVVDALRARTNLPLKPLAEPPIEGVRRLLLRLP